MYSKMKETRSLSEFRRLSKVARLYLTVCMQIVKSLVRLRECGSLCDNYKNAYSNLILRYYVVKNNN